MDSQGKIYDSEKEYIPSKAFKITNSEEQFLHGVPEDQRLNVLMNLRFKVWLSYNNLKPDTILKLKLKQAFFAGFMSNLQK